MKKYIASCSFGKDSLAMVLMLLEKEYPLDEVIFYDTGMEFQAIYNIRDRIVSVLDKKGIKYTELRPEHSFEWYMTEKPKRSGDKGYKWCGGRCRWGTTLKNQAINQYLKTFDETVVEYIGIARDESNRIKRERMNTVKIYPLIEWNMSENDCLVYCMKHGYRWLEDAGAGEVDLYEKLDRVSCWCCGNKNLREINNMKEFLPDYWERLVGLQKVIDMDYRKGVLEHKEK